LYGRGIANGVQGLELIGPERLHELEPYAKGIKAIYSPRSGITDFVKVAQAYAHAIQQREGVIITSCKVRSSSMRGGQILLVCLQPDTHIRNTQIEIEARYVITCGGLQSDKLSQMSGQKSEIRILPAG
jgi:(S)-2-hydroxyglutarate dehydrogenase